MQCRCRGLKILCGDWVVYVGKKRQDRLEIPRALESRIVLSVCLLQRTARKKLSSVLFRLLLPLTYFCFPRPQLTRTLSSIPMVSCSATGSLPHTLANGLDILRWRGAFRGSRFDKASLNLRSRPIPSREPCARWLEFSLESHSGVICGTLLVVSGCLLFPR